MASEDPYIIFCKSLSFTDKDGNPLPLSTIQKVLETYVLRFDPEYCLELGLQSESIPNMSDITFEKEIDMIPIETDTIQGRMQKLLFTKTATGFNFIELLLLYPDIRDEFSKYARKKAQEENDPEGKYTKTYKEWEFKTFRRNADSKDEDQLERVLESFGMNIRQYIPKKFLKHMKSYDFLKKHGIFYGRIDGQFKQDYYQNYLHFLVKILKIIGHYLCSKSDGKPVVTTLYHIIIASLNLEDKKKQSLAYVSQEALKGVKDLFTKEEGEGAATGEGAAPAPAEAPAEAPAPAAEADAAEPAADPEADAAEPKAETPTAAEAEDKVDEMIRIDVNNGNKYTLDGLMERYQIENNSDDTDETKINKFLEEKNYEVFREEGGASDPEYMYIIQKKSGGTNGGKRRSRRSKKGGRRRSRSKSRRRKFKR